MLNEEKRYYANLLATERRNMKKTWVILKGIVNKNKSNQSQSQFKLSDGTITNDKYMICEKFNEFFVSIGPNLAKKIPEARYFTFVLPRGKSVHTMFLEPVSLEEVTNIFQNLKNSAPGHDELNPSTYDHVSQQLKNH